MGLEESASGVRVHPGAAVDWELTHILWLLKAGVMIREEIVVVVKHRLVLYRLRLLELVMKVIHGWLVDSERRRGFGVSRKFVDGKHEPTLRTVQLGLYVQYSCRVDSRSGDGQLVTYRPTRIEREDSR